MKELTGSARIADDAISAAERFLERPHEKNTFAWFMLAYAALRILANIANSLDSIRHSLVEV